MTSFRPALLSTCLAATLCLLCLAWITPADAQRAVRYRDKEVAACLEKLLKPNIREARAMADYEGLLERIDSCVDDPDTLSSYCAVAVSHRRLASEVGDAEGWARCVRAGDCLTGLRRYIDRIKATCVCTQKGPKGCE